MTIDLALDSHLVILGLLLVFGIAHSGLAALRPSGEKLMAETLPGFVCPCRSASRHSDCLLFQPPLRRFAALASTGITRS